MSHPVISSYTVPWRKKSCFYSCEFFQISCVKRQRVVSGPSHAAHKLPRRRTDLNLLAIIKPKREASHCRSPLSARYNCKLVVAVAKLVRFVLLHRTWEAKINLYHLGCSRKRGQGIFCSSSSSVCYLRTAWRAATTLHVSRTPQLFRPHPDAVTVGKVQQIRGLLLLFRHEARRMHRNCWCRVSNVRIFEFKKAFNSSAFPCKWVVRCSIHETESHPRHAATAANKFTFSATLGVQENMLWPMDFSYIEPPPARKEDQAAATRII